MAFALDDILPNGVASKPYRSRVLATGGVAPYTYAVTAGALPDGLTLTTTGALVGTPTVPDTFNFTITATDSTLDGNGDPDPQTVALAYEVEITCPTITLHGLPNGIQDKVYGLGHADPTPTVQARGGQTPYSYAVTTGSLPSGLSLDTDTGAITGTPDTVQVTGFTVTATDANGCTGEREYILIIIEDPAEKAQVNCDA